MPQRVCRSNAQIRAEASASRWFMSSLIMGTGKAEGGAIGATIAGAEASGEAVARTKEAQEKIDAELKQLAQENRAIYRAAVKFIEAEDAYIEAREEIAARETRASRGRSSESSAARRAP